MYKDSVSTGNLSQHLRDAHDILLTRVLHAGRFIQTIAFVKLRNWACIIEFSAQRGMSLLR
jgi:hypothetical protein